MELMYVLLKQCVIISLVQIHQVVKNIMVHLVLMIYISNQVMFYLITDEPIFFIADMPHLIKKIVNALEMSSFKKVKKKYEILWLST